MSTPRIDAAKLSLRNESALCLHHIDRVFLAQEQLGDADTTPREELNPALIAEACANFACLLDYVEDARSNDVVTLAELAWTDKLATPGGVYIDPPWAYGDPED